MLLAHRTLRHWRQINYRRTDSLLAAEFLHELYGRHNPLVNPTRFANTIVVFRPWESVGYAPAAEWDILATRFGGRLTRQWDTLGDRMAAVLQRPREASLDLARRLDGMDLRALSDGGLTDVLLDIHHVPLGDIYEINLVQFEHALHHALGALILQHRPGLPQSAVHSLVARASASTARTVAFEEDQRFLELVAASRGGELDDEELGSRLRDLARRHAEVGAAYGADTVSVEALRHRVRAYLELSEDQWRAALDGSRRDAGSGNGASAPEWLQSDPGIRRLGGLLALTGEVRDNNKRLLGTITRHRGSVLAEVARRRGLPAESVRLYLLHELATAIEDRLAVPEAVLRVRAGRGTVLSRRQSAQPLGAEEAGLVPGQKPERALAMEELRGVCASSGLATGTVRVVGRAADMERCAVGDVIVAKGTDFDLILLLRMAGAIITEEGGVLSHAAVVARELGIPCLIDVVDATTVLREGEPVVVDADAGVVRRLEAAGRDHADGREGRDGAVGGDSRWTATSGADGLVVLDEAEGVEQLGAKAWRLARLAAASFPVPPSGCVLPARSCASLANDPDDADLRPLAAAIMRRYPDKRLSLRSSSTLEDGLEATSAGVFASAVDVHSEEQHIIEGLRAVLASRRSEQARAYHGDERLRGAGFAVLVAPYQAFSYQGVAVSRSPWDAGCVLVEHGETDGTGGGPIDTVTRLHIRREDCEEGVAPGGPAIPRLQRDLVGVAALSLRVEELLGDGPVEVEWGLRDHEVTLLQARPVAAVAAETSAEGRRR